MTSYAHRPQDRPRSATTTTILDPAEPTCCLELFSEPMMVNRGSPFAPEYEEVVTPLCRLIFDYNGTRIRAKDRRPTFFRAGSKGHEPIARNQSSELRARRLLEGFGLVELGCLEDYEGASDSLADYVINLENNIDSLCGFGAHAVPQLEKLGWQVTVHSTYQCQLEKADNWYADVSRGTEITAEDDDEGTDWFGLELGVQVGGERVNLLPILLSLLEDDPARLDLDLLSTNPDREIPVPLGGNRYLSVPAKRMSTILRVLLELYGSELEGGMLKLPLAQATSLAFLETGLGGDLRFLGDESVRDLGAVLADRATVPPAPAPNGLLATLRPYQQEGVSWMQHLRANRVGGILADDMGLGKTLQTIAHLLLEKESGRMKHPALVVAPTSLVSNWKRELARFAPSLRVLSWHGPKRFNLQEDLPFCDILLTSYPLLVRDTDTLGEGRYHYLVLDEAQTIKNPDSRVHGAVRDIDAQHRLGLTGTPLENNLTELWALFDFLMPSLLGGLGTFRTLFAVPIERKGSEARLQSLRERVSPYILRRMKREVASELPPKTEVVRPVELDGDQRDLYESIRLAAHERVRKVVKERGIAASTIDILDALLKLRQVCCDPRLVAVEAAREVEKSAKLELLLQVLPQLLGQGRRVLIFSQFTSMLKLIGDGLKERGISYAKLTGSTQDRQQPVDDFQNGKVSVFLISLKAGGTGLNLTTADTVIHYDPWWNPAVQAQATDRAYRIGQKNPVFVYNLIVAGSVEERIMNLQQRKKSLAESILADAKSASRFSESEIEDLFAPLA